MTRLHIAAALTIAFAAVSCASVENVITAIPDETFSLPIGKTAAVSGSPSRITFTRVTEDSRCPINAVCVWAGDAKIELTLARNGAPVATGIVSLSPQNNEAQLADLVVRFVSLAPAPVTPEPAPRQYVAELVIRKL